MQQAVVTVLNMIYEVDICFSLGVFVAMRNPSFKQDASLLKIHRKFNSCLRLPDMA
ncbi:hypothetical protein MIZ03_2138 [Rhodoferax lithotrophicus]|uniref:Uncharacterized protein n=1 Tax=Rhodoferax lithotrophicus TaxID=2798804 RepID=A0ABN6D5F6_9BURK|nr:hypothetical protein MIZ03_2138 [Rhodoferax sp. MIZ03]